MPSTSTTNKRLIITKFKAQKYNEIHQKNLTSCQILICKASPQIIMESFSIYPATHRSTHRLNIFKSLYLTLICFLLREIFSFQQFKSSHMNHTAFNQISVETNQTLQNSVEQVLQKSLQDLPLVKKYTSQ